MTFFVNEANGGIVIDNQELIALSDDIVFHVDLYAGDNKKKVETGTVVIIRE